MSSCTSVKKEAIGAISTATPEASAVGEKILQEGGNAIDAAIAIQFALAVTEPAMSGLGGGTQVLLSLKNQPPIAINGTTFSPKNIPDKLLDTLTFHRKSTIPSTVKVLYFLWKNYGSQKLEWDELIKPSIHLAEKGFKMGVYRANVYAQHKLELEENNHHTKFVLLNGFIPKEGDTLKQIVLAKTLKRLAKFGAQDFYKGNLAKDFVSDMQLNNGWITLDDLINFPNPTVEKALHITYRGYDIYSQPPPCGGWTTLLAIRLIDLLSNKAYTDKITIIKALFLAHRDREKYPIEDFKNYTNTINNKFTSTYLNSLINSQEVSRKENDIKLKTGETTHFSVIDSYGNAISVTSSINAYFGAKAANPKLGFLYNTYMDDFEFGKEHHPFAIKPNAMAYSSMSPTIVQKDGKNVLLIGSPGSSRIISTVAQLTVNWIETNTLKNTIKIPRIHVSGNKILLEGNLDTMFLEDAVRNKYLLQFTTPNKKLVAKENYNPYFGGVHAISIENKLFVPVADPRRDGEGKTVYNK